MPKYKLVDNHDETSEGYPRLCCDKCVAHEDPRLCKDLPPCVSLTSYYVEVEDAKD